MESELQVYISRLPRDIYRDYLDIDQDMLEMPDIDQDMLEILDIDHDTLEMLDFDHDTLEMQYIDHDMLEMLDIDQDTLEMLDIDHDMLEMLDIEMILIIVSAAFVTCSLSLGNRTHSKRLGCPAGVSIVHPMDRSEPVTATPMARSDLRSGGLYSS